jgi:hypothetical protein
VKFNKEEITRKINVFDKKTIFISSFHIKDPFSSFHIEVPFSKSRISIET